MSATQDNQAREIFDAHFHIIDPSFPLAPNQGYVPPSFTTGDYLERAAPLGVAGGAIVSGSFQAFDQDYLLAALSRLGLSFVGVTQLPADATDEEILRLDAAGVRAVRFNLERGGSEGVQNLERFAKRVHEVAGWHVELYVDSRRLPELEGALARLPRASLDHLGLSGSGFETLLRLVERGVRVKASGFGRVDLDVRGAMRDICSANPGALMFGTDLPSTRAPRPFSEEDVTTVVESVGEELARRILYDNAFAFYRLKEGYG